MLKNYIVDNEASILMIITIQKENKRWVKNIELITYLFKVLNLFI